MKCVTCGTEIWFDDRTWWDEGGWRGNDGTSEGCSGHQPTPEGDPQAKEPKS